MSSRTSAALSRRFFGFFSKQSRISFRMAGDTLAGSKVQPGSAVTTRPGMVFPESAGHMTALPRVSLNGNYQDARILPVLTSGAATAMWNGFRRVDAA